MDNEKMIEKKLDSYQYNLQDFISDDELRVTISLNEYRRLVTHDERLSTTLDKLSDVKKKAEAQIEEYQKEIADLKKELETSNKAGAFLLHMILDDYDMEDDEDADSGSDTECESSNKED